jgi:hypothetical protein
LYLISAITSDQCTYFGGDIAERHSVASSFLACQRFQIYWHFGDDRSGQTSELEERFGSESEMQNRAEVVRFALLC